ncbi:hypothetical protein BDV93DRAFT_575055 [Ceratobasidium sp. AG-I]|nr:hypothetical protein BDV93DRAFT_575055 [Ceratobasidium sp. AG-I]
MQSPEHQPNPLFHALYVSDILHLICDLLENSDWMSLMLTCKSMFATPASHVWASLDGVQVLTDLLVETTEIENDATTISESAVDFSRFDIYSPLVRHLRVYGRTSKYLRSEFRRRCALRSQQSALFPKLESITMRSSDLFHDSDALMWIEILAAPTLAELRIIPIKKAGATALVSYPATSIISKLLSETCPGIKRLELYSINITQDHNGTEPSAILWQDPFQQSFGSLIHLREVTASVAFIDRRGFKTLGALPNLQKLSIRGFETRPQNLQLCIPQSSFPALTDLSLVQVDSNTLSALMKVRPFARNLTSVYFSQWFYTVRRWRREHPRRLRWFAEALPLLLQHTHTLKSFRYDASETERSIGLGGYYRIEFASFLQSRLTIGHMNDKGIYECTLNLFGGYFVVHRCCCPELLWCQQVVLLLRYSGGLQKGAGGSRDSERLREPEHRARERSQVLPSAPEARTTRELPPSSLRCVNAGDTDLRSPQVELKMPQAGNSPGFNQLTKLGVGKIPALRLCSEKCQPPERLCTPRRDWSSSHAMTQPHPSRLGVDSLASVT